MTLFAIAFVIYRRLDIWRNCGLDIILIKGNQLYNSLNRTDYLSINDLPDRFQIGSVQVQVEYNINNYGIISRESSQDQDKLFFVQGFCFAIFFRNRITYAFD